MYGAGIVKVSSATGTKKILIHFLSKTKVTCYPHYSILDICGALWDLVPFAQFKKHEKLSSKIVTFSKIEACNFNKSNTPQWVFFIFFKLCKRY